MKLKIGDLAKITGAPTSSIANYEKAGLISPDYRTGGNIRLYNDSAIEDLRFLRICRKVGMETPTIKALMDLRKMRIRPEDCQDDLKDADKAINEMNSCLIYLKKEIDAITGQNES